MKRLFIIIIIFNMNITSMHAQTTGTIQGEYHLTGVREMASGFLFKEDATFEFYFSYGAIDRYGSGSWIVNDDRIVLNSTAWTGHDFKLVKSGKTSTPGISIVMAETNPMILNYVHVGINNNPNPDSMKLTDSKGSVFFEKQNIDSISLVFEFCAERTTVIQLQNKNDNHFEFQLEPTIMEVYFKNFVLKISDKGLLGNHPLLKPGEYLFQKD